MAESLFTTQTPGTQADAGHALTVGTVIVPAVAGQVTHGRWLFPTPVPSSAVAFVLYDATSQAELARATFSGATANTWVTVALSTPVSVTAGQRLVAAIYTPDRYVATGGFFNSAGLTNGNLSAPATGSDPIGNGRFNDPGDAYPSSMFNGNCYFADLVFVAGGGGASVAPGGVAVPVALGSPTSAWSGSSAPDGIAVPVTLGVPVLAWSGSVAPAGLSVLVAVGAPVVGATPVAPDGLAVPVALGAPSLAWSGSVVPDGVGVSVAVGAPAVTMPGTVVVRPSAGTVARPSAGVVVRPDIGVVSRP